MTTAIGKRQRATRLSSGSVKKKVYVEQGSSSEGDSLDSDAGGEDSEEDFKPEKKGKDLKRGRGRGTDRKRREASSSSSSDEFKDDGLVSEDEEDDEVKIEEDVEEDESEEEAQATRKPKSNAYEEVIEIVKAPKVKGG
jgi:hypothetical protein